MKFQSLHLFALGICLAFAPKLSWAFSFQYQKTQPRKVLLEDACENALSQTIPSKRVRLSDKPAVVFASWNVENVQTYVGKAYYKGAQEDGTYSYEWHHEKDHDEMLPWKLAAKQESISKMGLYVGEHTDPLPDFIVCPEVENLEAANQLLNGGPMWGRYHVFLNRGNDSRGFDIAFGVRSDLDIEVEMETHKDLTWLDPVENSWQKLFSRDIPVLVVRDRPTRKVVLLVFGMHDKSKRDRPGDEQSRIFSRAQQEAKVLITEQYKQRFGSHIPMMWMGDVNRNAARREAGRTSGEFDPELTPFLDTGFDAFDLAGVINRVTQTYHPKDGSPMIKSQLDLHLVSPSLAPYVLHSAVVPDFGRKGYRTTDPVDYFDRNRHFMSDHRAVVTAIDGRAFYF